MHISQLENIQRREFLRRASALGLAGAAGPLALSLSAMGEAAAANATDYKALVCIFLYGGNDHDNTFIPYDPGSHTIYKSFRDLNNTDTQRPLDTIYIGPNTLTELRPSTTLNNGRKYAVQPAMSDIASLFHAGQLGVLLNVGTLVRPTNKTQFSNAGPGDLPPKLFSHNDQFSLWQSGTLTGVEGTTKGWGGRLGDIFLRNSGFNSNAHFTCINANGNAVFLSGSNVFSYQVTGSGPIPINSVGNDWSVYGSSDCKTALRSLLKSDSTSAHWMEKEWARVIASSIDNQQNASDGIAGFTSTDALFKTDTLSAQMNIIAKLIGAAAKTDSALGVKRQVFFAALGGFDLHDNLMAFHSGLLQKVNDAMYSFYQATEQLGIASQVTTFTASDFGRTLASNGDGSDHGWGSHHMVMGGAVDGGNFWGQAPELADNGADTVGQGRLLPSTSVDELAAALSRWMGVPERDLTSVLPNLKNFSSKTPLSLFKSV
jgi:hypothetical protein